MWTEMDNLLLIKLVNIYGILVVVGTTSLTNVAPPAKFSLTSLVDNVQSAITGPNKCEAIKSILGLTYEQMAEKNGSNVHEALYIDLITKNGNVKFNLSMSHRLDRILANKTIVILVHGFLESSEGLMVNGLSPGLLKQPDLKILALDGQHLFSLEYLRSTTYARFMGDKLGTFLNEMIVGGQDPSKLILIGHSLGAHIAGIAGMRLHELSGKLVGRIIGLDPAYPCFGSVEPAGRLEKSDAEYVMVVHTNGGLLGILEPVGHTDWYPNGGQSQPGCYFSTCSHSRAWELLAESIVAPDHFPARKCESWQMFQDGLCSKHHMVYLGMNLQPPSPGSYFFSTAPQPPYGLGPTGSG